MKTLLTACFLVLLVYAGFFWGKRSAAPEQKEPERIEAATPNVLLAVQRLARVEGTRFHLERVIDLRSSQKRAFGMVTAEDAILLVAVGDVTAGVDLARIASQDLDVDWEKKRVRVKLPAAEILSSRIDNDKTYVHSRSTDVLAERKIDLESDARRTAEAGFRQAALDQGILDQAEASVELTVRSLLLSLGFQQVDIRFAQAPAHEGKSL